LDSVKHNASETLTNALTNTCEDIVDLLACGLEQVKLALDLSKSWSNCSLGFNNDTSTIICHSYSLPISC
jgi:hypothetical protein